VEPTTPEDSGNFNAIISSEKGHQAAMFSIDFRGNLPDEQILKIVKGTE